MVANNELVRLNKFKWQDGNISKTGEVTGSVFYVDGTNGSDTTGDGSTWDSAYATISKAITACTTLMGDTIYVRAGTYTLTAGLSLTKSGVSIIGVGGRPTITSSATATELLTIGGAAGTVDVYDVHLKHLKFTGSGTALTVGLLKVASTTGAGFTVQDTLIEDCVFSTTATTSGLTAIVYENGIRTTYRNCIFGQSGAMPAQIVGLLLSGPECNNLRFYDGSFLHHASATADAYVTLNAFTTDAVFRRCVMTNSNNGSYAIANGIIAGAATTVLVECSTQATLGGTTAKVFVTPGAQNAAGNALKNPYIMVDGAATILPG